MAIYSSIFISLALAAQPLGWAVQHSGVSPLRVQPAGGLMAPFSAAWGPAARPAAPTAGVTGSPSLLPAGCGGWAVAAKGAPVAGGWGAVSVRPAYSGGWAPAAFPRSAACGAWGAAFPRWPTAAGWRGAAAQRGAVIFNEGTRATDAAPAIGGLSALTVELWIKPSYAPRGAVAMQRAGTPPGHQGWQLWFEPWDDAGGTMAYFDLLAPGGASIMRYGAVQLHRWNHIAAVFDGSTIALYSNGVRRGAPVTLPQATAFPAGEYQLTLGPYDDLWFYGYVGRIGFLRISSTARYTGTSYAMPLRPPAVDAYTVAQYNFDERSGDTLHDATANGYDLTLYNAAWAGDVPPGWGD